MNYLEIRGKVLNDISDYINKVKFAVEVPIVATVFPAAVENGEIIPSFFRDSDPNGIARTSFTISELIEVVVQKKLWFKFVYPKDYLKASRYCQAYISNTTNARNMTNENKASINSIKQFQNILNVTLYRLRKTDPVIDQALSSETRLLDLLQEF